MKNVLLEESKVTISTLVAYSVPLRNLLGKTKDAVENLSSEEGDEHQEFVDAFKQGVALLNVMRVSAAAVRIINQKKQLSEEQENNLLSSDDLDEIAGKIATASGPVLPGDYIAIDEPIEQILQNTLESGEIQTNALIPNLTSDKFVAKVQEVSKILLGLFQGSDKKTTEDSDRFERFKTIIKRDFPNLDEEADIRKLFEELSARDNSDTDDEFIEKTENLSVAKKALVLMGFINAFYHQLEFGEPLEKEKILNKAPDPSYWHKWVSNKLEVSFDHKILKDTFKNLWTEELDQQLRELIERYSKPSQSPPPPRPPVDLQEAGRTRARQRHRRAQAQKRRQKRLNRTQVKQPPLPSAPSQKSTPSTSRTPYQFPGIRTGLKSKFIDEVVSSIIKPSWPSRSQSAEWDKILNSARALMDTKAQIREIIEIIINKLLKEENGKKELCN